MTEVAAVEATEAGFVTFGTFRELSEALFSGGRGQFGDFIVYDKVLFYGSNVFGVVGASSVVLIERDNFNSSQNDDLAFAAGRSGLDFPRRVRAMSSSSRLADLMKTNAEAYNTIVSVMGDTFDTGKLSALQEQAKAIAAEIEGMTAAFNTRYDKDFVAARYNAAINLRDAELLVKWDGGEVDINGSPLTGAGGQGVRLRYNKGSDEIQSNQGYEIPLRYFKEAFNLVVPYLFGDKQDELKSRGSIEVGRVFRNNLSVANDEQNIYLVLGCQYVHKPEVERIAGILGYPIDGTLLPKDEQAEATDIANRIK